MKFNDSRPGQPYPGIKTFSPNPHGRLRARDTALIIIMLSGLIGCVIPAKAQMPDPLRIECPGDVVVWTCGTDPVPVDYPDPVVRPGDCRTGPVVTCDPPSGSLFPPGRTTVTCTASNDCDERESCTFTVTVNRDITPPRIRCPGDLVVQAADENGAVVNYPLPSAIDDQDRNPIVTCTPPPGSLFPIGRTTVNCVAVDACTNRSTCTFSITVVREEDRPVIAVDESDDELILNWDALLGVLEFARDPAGPWHVVPGALPPYHTFPVPGARFFRLSGGGTSDPHAGAVGAGFIARAEANLGTWAFLPQSDWMFTKGQGWTHIRSGVRPSEPFFRSMSGHFLAGADRTPIAVYFTAEAYVDTVDKRMFVRALVNGEPLTPDDVVLTFGTSPENRESRGFVFTGTADRGLNTVEMQWLVDREATAYMRNAAFMVRKGTGLPDDRSFQVVSAPSGPSVSSNSDSWMDVPDLDGVVEIKQGDSLAITVSAESFTVGGGTMMLRALVDGQPANPPEVVFAKGSRPQSRLFNFGLSSPDPGLPHVRIQWQAKVAVGDVLMGDRSLVLSATPKSSSSLAQVMIIPASSPTETSSTSFTPIPGLSVSGPLPRNGELAVVLSGSTSVADNDRLRVRLTIDGNVVPGSDVQLDESDMHPGAHSFVFSAKHLYPEGPPPSSTIRAEWRVQNGQTASMAGRTMMVLVKPPTVPDLAEPPPMGSNNYGIESQIGTRRLLVICWDPARPGHPAPALNAVQQAVFGASSSVRHYFSVVSGGKYTVNSALGGNTILGWYNAAGSWDNYFDGPAGCGVDSVNVNLRRREMLLRAAQDIDFASFDANGDGLLDPRSELAVLLVIPHASPPLGRFRQVFDADCNPLVVDGVIIPFVAEWLTDAAGDEFRVAAHELSHLMLWLDDQYINTIPQPNTEAGRLSLMGNFFPNHLPHLDPLSKLALGWVTPAIVNGEGNFELQDVKVGRELIILPRLPGGAKDEYYILENRQSTASNVLYDKGLFDSGIAVWHVIEDAVDNGIPPVCMENWSPGNGNARRGLRLLRHSVGYFVDSTSLWSAENYNLLDSGLVCPSDAPTPAARRNALIWADGTPSGFQILNWSASGPAMTFQIIGP
jgi:M6 family metalloprotease-like protein